MNKDIRISLGWLDHPKTIKLERRLGWQGIKSLMRLWFFCAENRPEGELSGMDSEEIEIAAKWNGKAGAFVSTLEELKWLDRRDESGFVVHDWPDHNGYVIHSRAREERARKAAEARWTRERGGPGSGLGSVAGDAKTQISIAPSIAPSKVEQCPLPSPSPAPSPSPSPALLARKATNDPLNGSLEAILISNRDIFSKAYPGIDLEGETAKAKAWLVSNPKNRKTDLKRYLNGWFNREQNRVNKYPPREERFI